MSAHVAGVTSKLPMPVPWGTAVTCQYREFLRAGADVMMALTYYAHREKLRDVGREGDLEAMNRSAVRLAREVAAEGDALVADNVCNTWIYDPDDPSSSEAVRATYAEQLGWAVDEGIDFVISETNDCQQVLIVHGPAPDVPGRCHGQELGVPGHLERVTEIRRRGPARGLNVGHQVGSMPRRAAIPRAVCIFTAARLILIAAAICRSGRSR